MYIFYHRLNKGDTWESEGISVPTEISFPAAGRIIQPQIKELRRIKKRFNANSNPKSFLILIVKGKFEIPANDIEERNGNISRNTFKIQNEKFILKMINRDGYLWIEMIANNDFFKDTTQTILLEVLSIYFGRLINPICSELQHNDAYITTLISTPIKKSNIDIKEPFPHMHPFQDQIIASKEFIERYLEFASAPYSSLYGFWHKINRGWQGGMENAALAISVAIEGIIKIYFKDYGNPDDELKKQIDDALIEIKKINCLGERAKSRIESSLGNSKNSNPKSALRKLSTLGYFNKTLVDNWAVLRNMSAHADKLDN